MIKLKKKTPLIDQHDKFGFYEVGTQETENGKKKVSLLMFDTKSG